MTTLRQHLEAIRDRCVAPSGSDHWNCKDAEAALAILNGAETLRVDPVDDSLIADAVGWENIANPFERVRLVPDPEQVTR